MDDLTKEFIAESQEGLDRMERCLTELEMRPDDAGLLGEIFRAVHTIKGTTGFLGLRQAGEAGTRGRAPAGCTARGQAGGDVGVDQRLAAVCWMGCERFWC